MSIVSGHGFASARELFEAHKGCMARCCGHEGRIVGWFDDCVVVEDPEFLFMRARAVELFHAIEGAHHGIEVFHASVSLLCSHEQALAPKPLPKLEGLIPFAKAIHVDGEKIRYEGSATHAQLPEAGKALARVAGVELVAWSEVAPLATAARDVLAFLSGLNLATHPVADQQRQREIVSKLMRALDPGRAGR